MRWLYGLELLAYALWLGGMVSVALVAPAIFQVIPSRDLAGRAFGAILERLFPILYACALALLASGGARWLMRRTLTRIEAERYGLVAVMLAVLVYVGGPVLGEMSAIQASLPGPIETLPADSGPRLRFDELHKLSERLMGVDVALALVLLPLMLVPATAKPR